MNVGHSAGSTHHSNQPARRAYEEPRVTVHGTVDELTKGRGLLLTDGVLIGSVVA